MKNSFFNPNKHKFLTLDFYLQCFFVGLIAGFGILSFFSGYFLFLTMYSFLPILFYNSVGLTYHLLVGSYFEKIELFRKTHAISAIIYLIIFTLVFFSGNIIANEITFIFFWIIPPLFLVAYFFITLLDWKAMKKLRK